MPAQKHRHFEKKNMFLRSFWKVDFFYIFVNITTSRKITLYIFLKNLIFAYKSTNIKISRKITFFRWLWKHHCVFFHRSNNINISRKRAFFLDHFEITIFAHICENSKIREKGYFLDLYEKIGFCPYVGKKSSFRGKSRYFEITLK